MKKKCDHEIIEENGFEVCIKCGECFNQIYDRGFPSYLTVANEKDKLYHQQDGKKEF